MSKFAKAPVRANTTAPVRTTDKRIRTEEGALGWERDPKSELFLLAVANMVGEPTFYEAGSARDSRFVKLVHEVTKDDPDWVARFTPYLRNEMFMRSAPVVMAAEYVAAGGPNGRAVVDAACQRPDEPAELLAYWFAEHGRRIPAAIKRGLADAVVRLYNEKAALKYDGKGKAWRMGDVIELVHPKPKAEWQDHLFSYLLASRHNRENLPTLPYLEAIDKWVAAGAPLDALPMGVTWERLSSYRKMDKDAWEAVIPQMGYMALLRNLRNFDQAGISHSMQAHVKRTLGNADNVAKAKQFPFRFLSAYKELDSLTWGETLENALNYSLVNVPVLKGRTLILVDVSYSMDSPMSGRSKAKMWEAAALFGSALAKRAENADLHAYSNESARIQYSGSASLLKMIEVFMRWPGAGGGTETYGTLRSLYDGHDRVIVLTDEQAFDPSRETYHRLYGRVRGPGDEFKDIPLIYTFNLAGYKAGHLASGQKGRYTFGGLSDAGFRAIELLEAETSTGWPF